jgi:hypothetical protein
VLSPLHEGCRRLIETSSLTSGPHWRSRHPPENSKNVAHRTLTLRPAGDDVLRVWPVIANHCARDRTGLRHGWQWLLGFRSGGCQLRAHSGDLERSIRSIMNTDSGDHEHPLALA